MEPLRTLRQCLIDTQLAHLRVIARLWGLEIAATHHLEVAAELAEALTSPAHAAHVWEALADDQRFALTTLLRAGGVMPRASFARRFGEIRPMGPGRLEREKPWRDPISPAEGLWYRGLVYQAFAGTEGETFTVFIVPAELQAALPAGAETVAVSLDLKPASSPAHYWTFDDLLLDDLITTLTFVQNQVVRPVAGSPREWPETAREALARGLRDPDPERLAFILYLIDHLEWARVNDEGRLRLVAEPVTAWLKGASVESRAVLVEAWCEMADWNELWRLPSLQPDDAGRWRNDPTLARRALLRYLDALPPGEWVALADFLDAVKAADPDFQRPGGDYETWYIRDATSGEYLTGFESWDLVEGAVLRALLTGPAGWLGLVELGSEVEGEVPDRFRPLTGVAPTSVPAPAPPVVRPDLTVTMPATCHFERFQLARIADLAAAGDPYVYRLTPTSLGRARQQKISPERVLDFLDGLSSVHLPETVQSSLARWAERGTEVWLERTVLLSVTEPSVLQQIVSSPQTGRFVDRVVGPKAAVVAEKDWPKLIAALVELGLLADVKRDDEQFIDQRFVYHEWRPDGTL